MSENIKSRSFQNGSGSSCMNQEDTRRGQHCPQAACSLVSGKVCMQTPSFVYQVPGLFWLLNVYSRPFPVHWSSRGNSCPSSTFFSAEDHVSSYLQTTKTFRLILPRPPSLTCILVPSTTILTLVWRSEGVCPRCRPICLAMDLLQSSLFDNFSFSSLLVTSTQIRPVTTINTGTK